MEWHGQNISFDEFMTKFGQVLSILEKLEVITSARFRNFPYQNIKHIVSPGVKSHLNAPKLQLLTSLECSILHSYAGSLFVFDFFPTMELIFLMRILHSSNFF